MYVSSSHSHSINLPLTCGSQLIFVATPVPAGTVAAFESLSVPLHCLLSTNYEQPLLGSNYLLMEIKPTADGGLTAGTKAEIRLRDQPLFQLVSVLNKTRERAVYMQRQPIEEDDLRECFFLFFEAQRFFLYHSFIYLSSLSHALIR